jgi:hypothetical protein
VIFTTTMGTKYNPEAEGKLLEALDYIEQNLNVKVRAIAKEFGVNRGQLRSRLDGHAPLGQQYSTNTKLTA